MNEYKTGDKVEIINIGVFNKGFVKVGDIATFVKEDELNCSTWNTSQVIYEQCIPIHIKPWVEPKTKTSKLKFPCCVPTSEIKDEATLKALVDLFEANGARVYDGVDSDGNIEFERVDNWEYFGVSELEGKGFRTDFYDDEGSYSEDADTPIIATVYSVHGLLGKANSKPSVGIDSDTSGYKEPTDPLVSIVKDVKYTVAIKGVDFTFTQDEINGLTEELSGFSDDF
jgi:hypothetical protein